MKATRENYFDHNASTPVCDAALEAMQASFQDGYANAASVHDAGTHASYLVEKARAEIAALLGVAPEQLFFTSGGTESNNIAIHGLLSRKPSALALSGIEHPAVRVCAQHWAKVYGVGLAWHDAESSGRVDPARTSGKGVATIMLANNESGAIQDVAGFRARFKDWLHCDAVQAVGKIAVNLAELGVDSAALSAHKFYGPKGIGLLYLKQPKDFPPFMRGGSQESGRRPGTVNVNGIVGMAAALRDTISHQEAESLRLNGLRALLLNELERLGVDFAVNGDYTQALPNTLNLWLKGESAPDTVRAMADRGFALSAGAACASGSRVVVASPVMLAMGLADERAKQSVRISMGHANSEASVLALAAAIREITG